jgi:hypothetical protein
MSLNNLILEPRVLADLYPSSIVTGKTSSSADIQPIKLLGKHQKNILVLVSNESLPFLSDGELSFLTSVLSACKLSLADIALCNIYSLSPVEKSGLAGELDSQQVLLFGLGPMDIDLPINFPQFQLQPFNGKTYLSAPPLSVLETDKSQKLKLWNSLKNLFSL